MARRRSRSLSGTASIHAEKAKDYPEYIIEDFRVAKSHAERGECAEAVDSFGDGMLATGKLFSESFWAGITPAMAGKRRSTRLAAVKAINACFVAKSGFKRRK